MIYVGKIIPAVVLFFKFFVPFIRWATNAIKDDQVTIDEVVAAANEFWPKKDADGNPQPIRVPWSKVPEENPAEK